MKNGLTLLEGLGIFILMLSLLAVVFFYMSNVIGQKKRPIQFGLILTACIAIWYLGVGKLVKHHELLTGITLDLVESIIATLFWGALFWTLNKFINTYIWYGMLLDGSDTRVPRIVRFCVTFVLYLIAFVIVLYYVFEQPITAILASSGVVAFVLGYAAQSTLSELFAGIGLSMAPSFRKGDWVEINGEWGQINDSTWRTVSYEDMDGNLVTLPNSTIASAKVRNFELPNRVVQRGFPLQVDYNAPPKLVEDIINHALQECPLVLKTPAPFTVFDGYDQYGMRYIAYFYMKNLLDWFPISTQVSSSIWYAFREHGIHFAFDKRAYGGPEKELPLYLHDSVFNPDLQLDIDTLIDQIDIFKPLSDEQRRFIAEHASRKSYGPPQAVIRQGEKGESMFIIAKGLLGVYDINKDGSERKIVDLKAV